MDRRRYDEPGQPVADTAGRAHGTGRTPLRRRRAAPRTGTVLGAVALAAAVALAPGVPARAETVGASAAPRTPGPLGAPELTGYTYTEDVADVPAGGQAPATASCPNGDVVVGGGGYEGHQELGQDLNSSFPDPSGTAWTVWANDEGPTANTVVAVAICAASGSVEDYSVQFGPMVDVPAGGFGGPSVTCPAGTVDLSGGAQMAGTQTYQAMSASSGAGVVDGWDTLLSSSGAEGTEGSAAVVCASQPPGWVQVASTAKRNPAERATTVIATCPRGTRVLGGGLYSTSGSPVSTVGVTTSQSNLEAWHSAEDNAAGFGARVTGWAVCADAVPAP